MPQTHTNLIYHINFGTKERRPLINDDIRGQLLKYITGIIANHGGKTVAINGTADHVHILISTGGKKLYQAIHIFGYRLAKNTAGVFIFLGIGKLRHVGL